MLESNFCEFGDGMDAQFIHEPGAVEFNCFYGEVKHVCDLFIAAAFHDVLQTFLLAVGQFFRLGR